MVTARSTARLSVSWCPAQRHHLTAFAAFSIMMQVIRTARHDDGLSYSQATP
jgi:hypothetical protein